MVPQAPGYLRPQQTAPLTADQEAAIAATCPGLIQDVTANGRPDPVLWGPYREMMTGWATDPEVRFAGASGGALSAMLTHLLDSGTVDGAIQIGADPDLPIGNRVVLTETRDGVLAAAGSRYAPSAPLADLSERLADHTATGRRFAFVGKPCDAAALAALRHRDPKVAAAMPVIVSFFCAGVPSYQGGEAVLAALGTDLDQTAAFRFRGNGWPGRATATAHDGTERSMTYHDSWGKVLSKHVQHRCKICADGTGVAADIVCADAWESDAAGYPLFEEAPGVSLILARTDLGARLVADARDAGRIETEAFDPATLVAIQPGQRERRRALWARLTALRLLGRPVPRYRGLQLWAAARQNPLGRNVKNFLGTLRRALRARPSSTGVPK
ncbi:hypothetical protein JANAI61_37630 [Jannaschia sp. AI_61]|uniref:Coenzyme F420 hydrogenase/dehydrogenase, beta subunit C-terminal domain n=1 Tax=Jannaschia sp. AI_61 TaxID=2829796 RepID=UPI001BC32EB6|nr:Coenzyme F420 hydrogenase/dehydrogenase, beta subunit C-terminal domain [Jannaschia sp. AI_61]GIT93305.1 hypothetical protein JANAI61_37630 [Jannaschia sp. AI_61]